MRFCDQCGAPVPEPLADDTARATPRHAPRPRRRWVLPVGAGGCALVMGIGAFAFWPVGHASAHGHLAINVVDLPRGSAASVLVRGPHGFRRSVAASTAFDVPAGVYELDASPVTAGADRYFAAVSHARPVVHGGQTTTSTVD